MPPCAMRPHLSARWRSLETQTAIARMGHDTVVGFPSFPMCAEGFQCRHAWPLAYKFRSPPHCGSAAVAPRPRPRAKLVALIGVVGSVGGPWLNTVYMMIGKPDAVTEWGEAPQHREQVWGDPGSSGSRRWSIRYHGVHRPGVPQLGVKERWVSCERSVCKWSGTSVRAMTDVWQENDGEERCDEEVEVAAAGGGFQVEGERNGRVGQGQGQGQERNRGAERCGRKGGGTEPRRGMIWFRRCLLEVWADQAQSMGTSQEVLGLCGGGHG